MTFNLTESLTDNILFAMEDQNSVLLVDAKSGLLVAEEDVCDDEDRFYALPEWSSEDGYNLMEEFTSNLYAPNVHEELRLYKFFWTAHQHLQHLEFLVCKLNAPAWA